MTGIIAGIGQGFQQSATSYSTSALGSVGTIESGKQIQAGTYGITIFPISLDGGVLPEFPSPARDNGMARALDVKQVPYVALGNIKDRRLIPLGSGVLSVQDIVERIYILTQTQPGELY